MAFTKLEMSKDGSFRVTRSGLSIYRSYLDNNADGMVDIVYNNDGGPFNRESHFKSFTKKEHRQQYPLVFQEADKDFKEQMERFKTLCR